MQKGINNINSDASCSNKSSEAINTVFSFRNLYRSFEKCTNSVKWKFSTQNYMVNACTRIARLRKSILNGTYHPEKTRMFTICERGKTRIISASTFQDRIVQKCLCDNFLNPILEKALIYDCGATLKGKGLNFTRKRLDAHLQKYYRKHKNKGYILKIDLHDYFASIDHDILYQLLRKKIKYDSLYNFVINIIPKDIKGLGLGSQVSQICALFYLYQVDHFIKEKLRFKFYARYMDDLYIICDSKVRVEAAKEKIKKMIQKLKLQINETKTRIYELSKGFVFCKTRSHLTDTGEIVHLPTGHAIKRFSHKIRAGVDLKEISHGLISYLKHFNSFNLMKICITRFQLDV